jgi:predicted Co/Zn/Cd cation transporter (cation efflux family)
MPSLSRPTRYRSDAHVTVARERKGGTLKTEQGVLRTSIAVTILLAGVGIVFGLLSGSFMIVFDGVYGLTDTTMTIVALFVSNLIKSSTASGPARSKLIKHFTMGFWHLEPMVLGLNGILLTGAAIYGLINAIGSIMAGGRLLAFDHAIIYAVVTLIIAVVMATFSRAANRTIQSDFVALDTKAWLMSAALSAALLIAFVFGFSIQGSSLEWVSPYIDPAALALVCLVIIPIPAGTIKQALADILLVTPSDLKQHVDEVAREIVQRHGFLSYRAYVAKVGRGRQIELYFIAPTDWPPRRLEHWDRIRDEVGEAIGDDSPDRWLTIAFTTDPEWAD